MSDDDNFAPFCAFCLKCPDCDIGLEELKLYRDALGNYWCEEHWHRGKVMNWGARHGWPLLNLQNGTVGGNIEDHVDITQPLLVYYMVTRLIPGGIGSWYRWFVISKNVEVGYLAEAIIDHVDSQEQAS